MTGIRDPHEDRRKLFLRMEWVYVYAPPLLAVLIAVVGALALALFVPLEGTNFLGRWAMGVGLLLGVPAIAYAVKMWWEGRGG